MATPSKFDAVQKELDSLEDKIAALTARRNELQIYLKVASSLQGGTAKAKKGKAAATEPVAATKKPAKLKSGTKIKSIGKTKSSTPTAKKEASEKKPSKTKIKPKSKSKKTAAPAGAIKTTRGPSVAQQIINASSEILKQKSPLKPADLLPELEARGVKVNGINQAKQLRTITKILSATKGQFKSDRQLGWSLT